MTVRGLQGRLKRIAFILCVAIGLVIVLLAVIVYIGQPPRKGEGAAPQAPEDITVYDDVPRDSTKGTAGGSKEEGDEEEAPGVTETNSDSNLGPGIGFGVISDSKEDYPESESQDSETEEEWIDRDYVDLTTDDVVQVIELGDSGKDSVGGTKFGDDPVVPVDNS